MKKFILSVFVLLSAVALHAQKGIDFFPGSFDEAQIQASESEQLIFMDAYATWCGPCKWMAANTFTDAEVGKLFNSAFVNLKMDMEKGEGPRLARILKLRAYPTLFIMDADGKVLEKREGAMDAETFRDWATKAIKKHRPDLLATTAPAPTEKPASTVQTVSNGSDTTPTDLEELIGNALWDKDEKRFDALTDELWASGSEDDHLLYLEALRVWADEYDDQGKYLSALTSKLSDPQYAHADVLNNAAWYGLPMTKDKDALIQMANWTGRAIELKPDYYNHDTFAHIMFALEEYPVAREYAEKALEIARSTGTTSEETEKLLAQIPE